MRGVKYLPWKLNPAHEAGERLSRLTSREAKRTDYGSTFCARLIGVWSIKLMTLRAKVRELEAMNRLAAARIRSLEARQSEFVSCRHCGENTMQDAPRCAHCGEYMDGPKIRRVAPGVSGGMKVQW